MQKTWFGLLVLALGALASACAPASEPGLATLDVVPEATDEGDVVGGEVSPLPDDGDPPDAPPVPLDDGSPDVGPPEKEIVPCDDNADCPSGWCVETAGGKTCTETCIDECPKDWFCGEVSNTGQDVIFICLPRFVTLCRPCSTDAECAETLGSSGSKCLDYGVEGSFCADECGEVAGCPQGFVCDGGQCRRLDDVCECSWKATQDGAQTQCAAANELGTCLGMRSCAPDGLTACSAKAPGPETCDGVDNDCNGATDEGTGGAGCSSANEYGECSGVKVCAGGALECSAADPELEICDGKDNDCDGAVDQGFPDSDADGLADCVSTDDDSDGVPDAEDNCPTVANESQQDVDQDGLGDVCDTDSDGDGDPDVTDCAPDDPSVGAKNTELCNGVDDDCDSTVDEGFPDLDGDSVADCMDDDDDGDLILDAEDNCPVTVNPDQGDADGDGKGDSCDEDKDDDGDPDLTDCAPTDPAVHHGATEDCNGGDENCNQIVDEGFPDSDGDGVADCIDLDDDNDGFLDFEDLCPLVADPGQLDTDGDLLGDACDGDDDGDDDPDALDCAPLDAQVSHQALESCNGKDDDCDSLVDEAGASGCADYFFDDDGDGHGLLGVTSCLCAAAPPWSAAAGGDCNDKNPQIFPGASEVCNVKDDDCDEEVDEGAAIGCQDAFADGDADGFGAGEATCVCPGTAGFSGVAGDCDDQDAQAKPGALEVCNAKDDDCDSLSDEPGALGCEKYFLDVDDDGYGVIVDSLCLCAPQGDHTAKASGDCADGNADVYPGNFEACDLLDNNCNGQIDEGVQDTFYLDDDEDGFGASYNTKEACSAPEGYVAKGGDCNDFNDTISPGAAEACDFIDNDCDGQTDEDLPETVVFVDLDGDGHGAKGTSGVDACLLDEDGDGAGESPPDGFSLAGDDCDDSSSTVFPSAPELCDGVLNDCGAPAADYHCPEVCAGEWPVVAGFTVGWPVAAQLDATAPLEVVAQGSGTLIALRSDGSVLWQVSGSPTYSYPVLADFNGDGHPDPVLFESGQVRILRSTDGVVLETHVVPSTGYRQGVVFDLDNDGHLDLVTPTGSQLGIVLRDGAGGAKAIHVVNAPASTYFAGDVPGAVDIDDDGIVEVVVGTAYGTCNGGNAPPCSGRILVIDPLTGSLVLDPDVSFAVSDPSVAWTGGPWPFFLDTDDDGEVELFHSMGGAGLHAWNLDGTPASYPAGWGGTPRLAPVDGTGVLDLTGQLHDIGGGAIDLDDDGQFEIVQILGDGLNVKQGGQVMDGYPVKTKGSGSGLLLSDINRDGRADVLFVGTENASINCYTLGEQTFAEDQLLTNGNMEPHSGALFRTGSVDPYEPNQATGFDPTTATDPIAESRAFPMRGFKDVYGSSSGWTRSLRAVLGTKGDRDFYWVEGTQISTSVTTLVGPLNPDLHVHMYKPVGGSWEYVTTRSSTGGSSSEKITCHNSDPCPDATATGTKLLLIEVRPHDSEVDFGPWPYRLRIHWGAG